MKTNFRRKSNPDIARRKQFLIVFSLFIFGIFFFSMFRGTILTIFNPIWQSNNFVSHGVKNFFSILRDKQSLVRENESLKERLVEVELLERNIRVLEETEEEMLNLFGRFSKGEFVSAGVLAHPPKVPYDTLVVDVGREDGVEVGDKVSATYGGALGLISEVQERESKVLLYTSSGMEIEAYLDRGDLPIKLLGQGGGAFVSDLPREAEVVVGDKIFLPGIDTELVAVVEDVLMEPTDSKKTLSLSGVINVSSIRFVEIWK